MITTGGVLTGSTIAVRGMNNRTQQVRTFEILPLHNNKRVNCILTVPGYILYFPMKLTNLTIFQIHEWPE